MAMMKISASFPPWDGCPCRLSFESCQASSNSDGNNLKV